MIKKISICVLFCIVLCSIAGCAKYSRSQLQRGAVSTVFLTQSTEGEENMDDICKLIVRGKEIDTISHIKLNYQYHYAELPLTTILKELGANVKWQDQTTAKITFEKKDYFLDIEKGSLVEEGKTFNYLIVAPGSKHGVLFRVADNEFFIDSDSAKMLLINVMGAKISIDYDERIVSIG